MIDKETMQGLKQVNVSQDAEKTMSRVRDIWKPLPKDKRDMVLEKAELKKVTIERAYHKGNIQARLVVALSEVLEIDPLFITGQSDEQRPFSEALVLQFLKDLGYLDAKATRGKRKYQRKAVETPSDTPVTAVVSENQTDEPEKVISEATDNNPTIPEYATESLENSSAEVFSFAFNDIPAELSALYIAMSDKMNRDIKNKIDKLTEEELVLLLKSQFIQANFDCNRENRLSLVKYLLVN
jgi:hypothetical protein